MTWMVSATYAAAGMLLGRALLLRRDDTVLARLRPAAGSVHRLDPLASMGRRLAWGGRRAAQRLSALGTPEELDRTLGVKGLLSSVGAVLGLLTWGLGLTGVAGAGVLAAGAWILPDMALARRLAARRARSASSVPEALDLVALAVGAGLTPSLALERAAGLIRGPLGDELRRAEHEVALGAPWETALRGVAGRSGAAPVRRLAVTLARGRRLGTPLAGPLRRLAADVRSEERATAEERARRAPVVMLFPLVLCVLPAFVVAAVIPAVMVALRGLR